MKKFYFLLLSFLALSLCANAVEKTVKFDFSKPASFVNESGVAYETDAKFETGTKLFVNGNSDVLFEYKKINTSSSGFYSGHIRVYKNDIFYVKINDGVDATIKSVSFTYSESKYTDSNFKKTESDDKKTFTYEHNGGQNRYVTMTVVYDVPVAAGEVEMPTFSLESGTYYGTQEVTIQIPDGADGVLYTTDGSVPSYDNNNSELIDKNTTTPITVSKTTTIKAIAVDNSDNKSAVAEATYTILPSIANTKETALTVAEAKNLIDNTSAEQLADPTQKVYVKGTISSITKLNSDNTITYLLDGDAFTIYRGKYLGEKTFASVDDLAVGASVIVYGNLYYYSATSLYEMNTGNYLVEYTAPAGFVEKPVITETSTPDFGYSYYTTSTATATIASATEGATIKYAITGDGVTDAATIESWTEGATVSITSEVAGTKILWAKAVKGDNVSDAVKKQFTFINPPKQVTFTKVTDASQLVAGAKYAIINATTTKIVSGYDKSTYTSTTTSASDGIVTAMDNAVIVFTLGGNGDEDNSWTLYDNTKGQYVVATTGTSFAYVADASEFGNWTITFVGTEGSVKIYNGTRGFNFMNSSGAVKNYAISNYGANDFTYPTLWQMVEETETGLDAVLDGNVGCKYQINCVLRVNHMDPNYVYASTTENNSSKKNTANEGDKGKGWSDVEKDFTQNDWVAIKNSGLELGDQVAIGSVATLVSNGAFPVIEFVSMSKDAPETPFEANTFRVANFNIGKDENAVKYVWLVAPQAGEFCHVRGYVAAAEGGKVTLKSAKESSTVTIGVTPITVDPVEMTVNYTGAVTTGNWFSFTGIVVNGSSSLELNAVSAKDVSTGVEGVEASSVKVYGAEGVINVVSEEVAPIAVYSANGAIVSSVEASSASIAVAPGFYIVKAGNSVSKVTVK